MKASVEFIRHMSLKRVISLTPFSKQIPKLLSLGLGLLLIGWLLVQLDFSAACQILQDLSVAYVFLGLVLYSLSFYFRVKRFRRLLPQGARLHTLVPIVLVHYTALNIIPARLGEFSYVYFLKRIHHISTGISVSTLLVARVFDQMAISSLFLFSLAWVELTSPWLKTVSCCVGGGLILSVAFLVLLLVYKRACLRGLMRLLRVLNWEHCRLAQRGITLLEDVVEGLDVLGSARKVAVIFMFSLFVWLSILGVNYMTLRAFQVRLSYVEVMLASTFLILLTVIPFQIFSGLGLRSMTWTVVAGAMGVSKDTAIVSALGSRVVTTCYLVLLGSFGLWKISGALSQEEQAL
ncbi:hypothetical protein CSB45_10920 [candidate division KSB3 bacterium]|uniref:TIGR00374 family protein n=1 Tax=candidate division KSB3 bacterium TaxID=2044937 RepID=A0A2G6E3N8_9BACT|nr:MAG: hypothetical protein CSB45_10920 [candidate division KSB3 bacterium]PIE29077.1 MAG: hypothetical protein CSA57_10685 [candidate division KSB3 bacterium]